ncbi:MAG: hypothetical protein NVS2B16_21530 [Chloroflexota bacterium]
MTLCAAVSAVAWGDVASHTAMTPVLRYGALLRTLRKAPYTSLFADEPVWVRWIGIEQMLLFIGALAPFGGPATRRCVRVTAPLQTPLQIGGLMLRWNAPRSRAS